MLNENVNPSTVDYMFITKLIPDVMNALYNDSAFQSTSLDEIRDAFRIKQMQGKAWLLNQVAQHSNTSAKVLVIGSWIGFTSYCLYKMGYSNITEVDPDARLEPLALHLNRFNKEYKHITADVNNIDVSAYDIVINTSCEHILDNTWYTNIPAGVTMFLHSIDYPSWDHTNLCANLSEMVDKYPMKLIYSGTLDLTTYKRFMLVGQK